MSDQRKPSIYVTGDAGTAILLYVEGHAEHPPNIREAWVNAKQFCRIRTPGAPGSVVQLLWGLGVENAWGSFQADEEGESIYILTKDSSHLKRGKKELLEKSKKLDDWRCWRVAQAIVIGETDYRSPTPDPEFLSDKGNPLVIYDFQQGWLTHNRSSLCEMLAERSFLIRTHDPRKEEWKEVRSKNMEAGHRSGHRRIWFSPIQDMADGALRNPGNWEDLKNEVECYLREDDTLHGNGVWLEDIIVQVYEDGALWMPAGENEARVYSFLAEQPRSYSWRGIQSVVGGGVVLVASLAQALQNDQEALDKHIRKGLRGVRQLLESGYRPPPDSWKDRFQPTCPAPNLGLSRDDAKSQRCFVDPEKIFQNEGSLAQLYRKPDAQEWCNAAKMVYEDDNFFKSQLSLQIGKYSVADPSYARILLELVAQLEAFRDRRIQYPGVLSFAIFGGPGSGKSFLAKQLARAIDPREEVFQVIEKNLSQFENAQRLVEAFEEVRAANLQGRLPLVLWDEFDTSFGGMNKGGWLSRFLMPMQDRKYLADSTPRVLGSAVFVFIGGTFRDGDNFKNWIGEEEGSRCKGPDFHSRLAACFEVPSIDVRKPEESGCYEHGPERANRAVLLRTFLKKHSIRRIDEEVLAILLHLPLMHGARSLEKLVDSSALSKTSHFQKRHLPPESVLKLHVRCQQEQSLNTNALLRDLNLAFAQTGTTFELAT